MVGSQRPQPMGSVLLLLSDGHWLSRKGGRSIIHPSWDRLTTIDIHEVPRWLASTVPYKIGGLNTSTARFNFFGSAFQSRTSVLAHRAAEDPPVFAQDLSSRPGPSSGRIHPS